jgi:hypothetical protein
MEFKDFEISVFREKMLLHIFLADIYSYFWFKRNDTLEILHSEIDNFGYDIVICANDKTRHVQLKSLVSAGANSIFKINERLATKQGGCVIIQEYKETGSKIDVLYHFFEVDTLENYKTAKHTKANAEGIKKEREGIKEIPKRDFKTCQNIEELIKIIL